MSPAREWCPLTMPTIYLALSYFMQQKNKINKMKKFIYLYQFSVEASHHHNPFHALFLVSYLNKFFMLLKYNLSH